MFFFAYSKDDEAVRTHLEYIEPDYKFTIINVINNSLLVTRQMADGKTQYLGGTVSRACKILEWLTYSGGCGPWEMRGNCTPPSPPRSWKIINSFIKRPHLQGVTSSTLLEGLGYRSSSNIFYFLSFRPLSFIHLVRINIRYSV